MITYDIFIISCLIICFLLYLRLRGFAGGTFVCWLVLQMRARAYLLACAPLVHQLRGGCT